MFNKRKGQRNARAGQSTVEYIVLVTAVLAVAIAFMTSPSGPFQTKLNGSLETVSEGVTNMADRLSDSHGTTNEVSPAPPVLFNVLANQI